MKIALVFLALLVAGAQASAQPCRDLKSGKFVPCPPDIEEVPPVDDPEDTSVHHDEVPPFAPLPVPTPTPTPEGPSISVVAGGQVLLTSGDAEKPFKALGRILVDWPLAGTERPMGALVVAEVTALPGRELSLSDSKSFNAVEVSGAVWYNPIPKFYGSFYCEGGFASAYSDAVGPNTNAPLWAGCGVYFEDSGTKLGRLKLGLGPDERPGYGWAMAIQVMGQLRLVEYENLGVTLTLRAILPLEENPITRQRTTVITAGAGVSWDSKRGAP